MTEKKKPEKTKKRRVQSDFPKHNLETAIRVPRALEDANGGQPLPPIETATALGMSPGSSDFRVILSSSLKYGLTTGSYRSDRIELASTGREIVEPTSDEERSRAILNAALAPETFRKIYDYYKGKKLPEQSFFQNTVIREFQVPREHAAICVSIFVDNMDFVGLVRTTKSGRWLSTTVETPGDLASDSDQDVIDASDTGASEKDESGIDEVPPPPAEQEPPKPPTANMRRVFITHGKNKAFVDPIKKLLGFGELVPVVSVERSSVSKPVPEKVMDDMRSCGAAIIHVEAEQTLIDQEANEHVMINPNVLIEIGAAMALYGRRFILLVREGVKLPSNLQGLYEVRYVGDTLDGEATIRLLEAINDIKKNQLPTRVLGGGTETTS